MAMTEATLAKKANDLKNCLEAVVMEAEAFKDGQLLNEHKMRLQDFIESEEFKKIKEAEDVLRFLKFYVNNDGFAKIADTAYLASTTESFLMVLEKHKIIPTETMICKLLECASYQKWQCIKADAWGKNENKREDKWTRL